MRRHATICALLAALSLAAPGAGAPSASVAEPATRVAFAVRTVLTTNGARAVLSDAVVEGPPGTDLTVDAGGGPYTIAARLKTDLVESGALRVKADVTTRRVAGTSERGLDLFEEDVHSQICTLALDGTEALVVMPFGRNPGGDELAIEFLPSATSEPAREGTTRGPTIRIASPGPGSWIRITASRGTHRFAVEAQLLDGERVAATGAGECRIEEPGTLVLSSAGGESLAEMRLTVDRFAAECPRDRIDFRFDLAGYAEAAGWAGVTSSTEEAGYDLGGGRRLRLRIVPLDRP